jgi:hypothetical protein
MAREGYSVALPTSMQIEELELDLSRLILSSEQEAIRTPGIHVSQVLRYIRENLGQKSDFDEAELGRFALVGRLWEAQLAEAMFLPPRYERIGEIERDGIIGSPDCYDFDEQAVGEFKVTWRSARRDIAEFVDYWRQIKAYCHMLDTQRAFLCVFYICGIWNPPVPICRRYDVTFSQLELEENWRMILNNAKEFE